MKRPTYYLLMSLLAVNLLTACSSQELRESWNNLQIELSPEKKKIEAELTALEEQVQGNFYYQQLDTDAERRVYLQFVNGLEKLQASIDIDSVDEETYTRAYLSVANDFPEFYWLTNDEAMEDGIDLWDLREPVYPINLAAVNNAIEKVVATILDQAPTSSDYEKVKYFYEFIIKQTDYDIDALTRNQISWRSQGIPSVLLDEKSVCAGYSRTFQYLCKRAGIECIYVTGSAKDGQETEIGHAWNLVNIDGKYYGVDTTWGDPVFEQAMGGAVPTDISYDYLCVTDDFLLRSRIVDKDLLSYWGTKTNYTVKELVYPPCDDNSLNYYLLMDAYFANFNEESILQAISKQVGEGRDKVFLQFADETSLQEMIDLLSTENNSVFDALGGVESYQYFYHYQTYTIELTGWY